jgi:hypothetical protein
MLSVITDRFKLGSVANQEMINSHTFNSKTDEQFKQEMVDERACREAERDTDRASRFQSNVMPEFGDDLVSFHIEFCFSYNAEDGKNYLAWIEGVIESIGNAKQRMVMIRWNEEKVAEGDLLV